MQTFYRIEGTGGGRLPLYPQRHRLVLSALKHGSLRSYDIPLQTLASLLYEAASQCGYVDPRKIRRHTGRVPGRF